MQGKKFAQLDSIRFFAIFLAAGGHWGLFGDYLPEAVDPAFRGVDLFFVLSGFLITLGLFNSSEKYRPVTSLYKFYIKRFLRIFPVYYLTLFLFWCLNRHWAEISLWWNLTYLSNFYLIKVQNWDGPSHLWSLAIEEQFYLVWPFVILFIPKRQAGWVIIFSIALSIAAKIYWLLTGASWWVWYVHPLSSLDSLAIGALLAYMYRYHRATLTNWLHKPYVTAVTFAVVAMVTYLKHTPLAPINMIAIRFTFGLFCAVIIGRATEGYRGVAGNILNNSWLQYIGKISYGIYLFIPVPWLVEQLLPNGRRLGLVLDVVLVILLASVSWYFFEKPILKFKERFN